LAASTTEIYRENFVFELGELLCKPTIDETIESSHCAFCLHSDVAERENPSTIPIVRSVLEKNSWYETRWKPQLEKLPETERDELLFMLAARWRMTFAPWTKPRAVCRGITQISRSSPKAS
jgi:hypothetical protein